MRPGRHWRNRNCHGRIYNPPLQVRWLYYGIILLGFKYRSSSEKTQPQYFCM